MWCDLGSSESIAWREEDLARIFRGTIHPTTNCGLHFRKFPVANGTAVYRICGTEGNLARCPKLLEISHREFPFHLIYPPGIFDRMARFSIFVERSTTRSFSPVCWKFCSENTVHVCEYSVSSAYELFRPREASFGLKGIFKIMNRKIILVYSAKKPKQSLRLSDKTVGDFGLASSRPISILPVDATSEFEMISANSPSPYPKGSYENLSAGCTHSE